MRVTAFCSDLVQKAAAWSQWLGPVNATYSVSTERLSKANCRNVAK
jgi:hypothetical protein